MPGRTIAIGDIHGYPAALRAIFKAIDPQADDLIVTMGDYVDRGPDSRGVLDELIDLQQRFHLVTLLGNHDEVMLDICRGRFGLLGEWPLFGGDTTIASYGGVPEGVPQEHVDFLAACEPFWETPGHLFVHANYWNNQPLEHQSATTLRWESLKARLPGPHYSGKTVITGHTAQKDGEILDLGYLKCIDTYCYGDGWLTALDVDSAKIWQADKHGRMR